jgi:hypothetical protein
MRVTQLQDQLADARGGQVVFLSHCLLNENVRYLGGAGPPAGVSEVVDGFLSRGIGICQLPCPGQLAWGGVLKRRMLLAYGSADTLWAPVSRLMLRPFIWYTRHVYARLARSVTPRHHGLPPVRHAGGRPGRRWCLAVLRRDHHP